MVLTLLVTATLALSSLLGSIIVIIGLYILLWGKKKEMQKLEQVQDAQAMKEQEQRPLPVTIRVSVDDDSRCP